MKKEVTTYGKQNKFITLINSFKENKFRTNLLRSKGLSEYKPKINKFKLGIASFSLICLIPGLPIWFIPIAFIWAIK